MMIPSNVSPMRHIGLCFHDPRISRFEDGEVLSTTMTTKRDLSQLQPTELMT